MLYKADCLGKGAKLGTKINILRVKVMEGDIGKVILSYLCMRSKMGIILKVEQQSRNEQLRTPQSEASGAHYFRKTVGIQNVHMFCGLGKEN